MLRRKKSCSAAQVLYTYSSWLSEGFGLNPEDILGLDVEREVRTSIKIPGVLTLIFILLLLSVSAFIYHITQSLVLHVHFHLVSKPGILEIVTTL